MDSQCPWCLGQAVVTLRLPCVIVESPWRHKRVPFINIAFLRSRSIKRRQWKHKLDYYGVVFAHLTTGCGIKAKDPSGLDSDRWIPHSRCCENPAWAKALAGFSRHLSAGFTDLNPRPRGLSLYNVIPPFPPQQALFLPPISARARTAAGVQTAPYLCNGGYFSETSLRSRIPPARPRDPVIHIKPQAPKARGYCCRCLIRIQVRNKEQSLSPEPRLNGECWDTVTLAQSALNWSG